MRTTIVRLFQILFIILPLIWSSSTDELFEFNKMMTVYAFSILIGMVWFWRIIKEKRLIISKSPFGLVILFFLISQMLSTIFSIHPHTSFFGYYSRFHGGLLSTLAYLFLFWAFISNSNRQDLPKIIFSLLLGAGLSIAYALPEKGGVSPSCALLTGEFTTECWSESTNPKWRIFGTFGQPNWLAAYLIMILPLAWWQMISVWRKKLSVSIKVKQTNNLSVKNLKIMFWETVFQFTNQMWLILLGFVSLLWLTLLFTGSRSGLLGAGVAWVLLLVGSLIVSRSNSHKSLTRGALVNTIIGGLVGLILIVLVGSPFTGSVFKWRQALSTSTTAETTGEQASVNQSSVPSTPPEPVSGTVLESGGTDSGKIRAIVWQGALDVWQRYPLLGSGLETFAYSYYRDRPVEHNLVSEWDFLYNKAHNEFLNILANSGVVGLLSYLAVIFLFLKYSFSQILANKQTGDFTNSTFYLALASGFVGLQISNFFGFSTVVVGLLSWVWLALAQVASASHNKSLSNSSPSATKSRVSRATQNKSVINTNKLKLSESQWLTIATASMVSLMLLAQVWGTWHNDRLMSQAKQSLQQGLGLSAYQTLTTLTSRAPNQAEYWEQLALTQAQLAASAQTENEATAAAYLAQQAHTSIDQATNKNPVHLNIWKSRARVFIWLAIFEPDYYQQAINALEQAQQLAPSDAKIVYNLALLSETVDDLESAKKYYQKAIELKPNYEQARKNYAEFLTRQKEYAPAISEYKYIDNYLRPTEPLFSDEIASLEAKLTNTDESSN